MRNFCTLFDSNYLTRALVMYRSLEETGENFKLYSVCFDDLSYQILRKLNLPRMVAIQLPEFETPQLLAVKNGRSTAEYCWTCTPHVIRHMLDTYRLPEVTYIDADLCFYSGPSQLFAEFEMSGASVLITEHRYTPRYDQSKTSGIYCVQFVTFNSDVRGLKALQWWQDRCLEWCYARFENGKFGDQKYLDDWTERFEGVHVLQHLGGGVAPWNVQQYLLEQKNDKGLSVNCVPLIFYHFHAYKHYTDGTHDLGIYRLASTVIDLLYRPYAERLEKVHAEIATIVPEFAQVRSIRSRSLRSLLSRIRRKLRGQLIVYHEL
jgi:hypothetical protein